MPLAFLSLEDQKGSVMEVKLLEIRDRATLVPMLAVAISGDDGPLARRAGFGMQMIMLTMLTDPTRNQWDPYSWGDRTFKTAHIHIDAEWEYIKDGDVIDVEYILGETKTKKVSQCEL